MSDGVVVEFAAIVVRRKQCDRLRFERTELFAQLGRLRASVDNGTHEFNAEDELFCLRTIARADAIGRQLERLGQ